MEAGKKAMVIHYSQAYYTSESYVEHCSCSRGKIAPRESSLLTSNTEENKKRKISQLKSVHHKYKLQL